MLPARIIPSFTVSVGPDNYTYANAYAAPQSAFTVSATGQISIGYVVWKSQDSFNAGELPIGGKLIPVNVTSNLAVSFVSLICTDPDNPEATDFFTTTTEA